MTSQQIGSLAQIKMTWSVAHYKVLENGDVVATCEDGDVALIHPDGSWEWEDDN